MGIMVIRKKYDKSETFLVMVYHVTDANGGHRFLTMNSFAVDALGGTDRFEAMLAKQYKTFELLGTNPTIVMNSVGNRCQVGFPDPQGAERLRDRILKAMNTYPNSSHCLEPWLPEPEESVLPPINPKDLPWRPMSTFKKGVGEISLQRIVLVFEDTDIRDLVKPEFVSVATARGGAILEELKGDIRKSVEPELIRAIEEPHQGTGQAVWGHGIQPTGPEARSTCSEDLVLRVGRVRRDNELHR
jgi:hypothetical protein